MRIFPAGGPCRYWTAMAMILPALVLWTACMPSTAEKAPARRPGYSLTIRQYPGMTVLASASMPRPHTFSLSFIHSVTMTPVMDHYQVTSGGIRQTAEVFESHCAGLPFSDQETGATQWEQRNGKFILHMDRAIPVLVVRTDRRYQNRLHLPDRTINLNQWPDQALLLEVGPEPGTRTEKQ